MSTTKTTTIDLPGAFADWFGQTALVAGQDDSDPDCLATRQAYEAGTRRRHGRSYSVRVTASPAVLRLLAEYGRYLRECNADSGVPSELAAANKVIERANKGLLELGEEPYRV
ncbi:hypothetical protein ACWDTT_15790 [Streptosporangium sandarakinum]